MSRPKYLTPAEFADIVRLHPSKVRQRIHRGEIKANDVGTGRSHRWRISEAELERYLKAGAA